MASPRQFLVEHNHPESGGCQLLRANARRPASQDCDTFHFFRLVDGSRSCGDGMAPPLPLREDSSWCGRHRAEDSSLRPASLRPAWRAAVRHAAACLRLSQPIWRLAARADRSSTCRSPECPWRKEDVSFAVVAGEVYRRYFDVHRGTLRPWPQRNRSPAWRTASLLALLCDSRSAPALPLKPGKAQFAPFDYNPPALAHRPPGPAR